MTKNQQEAIERACGHENLLQDLIQVLKASRQWMNVDKWRYDKDPAHREFWQHMVDWMDDCIARATSQDVK